MLKRQRPPGRRRSAPAPGRRDGGTEGGRAAWWSLVRARGLSPRRTHLYSGRRHVGHEERRDVSHRCWWTDDAVTAAAAGSPAEKLERPRGPRVDPMAAASRTRVRDPGARARAAGCVPVSGLPERGRDGAKPTEIRVTGSKGSEAAAAHAREGRCVPACGQALRPRAPALVDTARRNRKQPGGAFGSRSRFKSRFVDWPPARSEGPEAPVAACAGRAGAAGERRRPHADADADGAGSGPRRRVRASAGCGYGCGCGSGCGDRHSSPGSAVARPAPPSSPSTRCRGNLSCACSQARFSLKTTNKQTNTHT